MKKLIIAEAYDFFIGQIYHVSTQLTAFKTAMEEDAAEDQINEAALRS